MVIVIGWSRHIHCHQAVVGGTVTAADLGVLLLLRSFYEDSVGASKLGDKTEEVFLVERSKILDKHLGEDFLHASLHRLVDAGFIRASAVYRETGASDPGKSQVYLNITFLKPKGISTGDRERRSRAGKLGRAVQAGEGKKSR